MLPPKWASRFIDWLTRDGSHSHIPGDLYEEYGDNLKRKGNQKASMLYIWTVIRLIRPFILREKLKYNNNKKNTNMLPNYWLVAKRFILKNQLYSGIKIIGLAIGIASSLVLLLYVSNEVSFDRFHKDGNNIYRLLVTTVSQEREITSPIITAAIAPTLKEEIPEIINYVRFSSPSSGFLTVEDKKINVKDVLHADSTVFNVFSFNLEKGNERTALASPYSIVLTPELAYSLFGEDDPIGKQVLLNGEMPLLVSGVVEKAPTNSQIQYSCLISFSTLSKEGYHLGWNGGWNYFEYIQLTPGADVELLKSKFPPIADKYINNMLKQYQVRLELYIQPLFDVHLHSEFAEGDWQNKGSMQYIYIFGAIALITLIMASINFINLTASQALTRLKEIGVRKAIGATRKMLIYQFLFESFVFTFLAFALAMLIITGFSNIINEFLGYRIEDIYLSNGWLNIFVALVILAVAIGAGAYPAFYLSSISSLNSLKKRLNKGSSNSSLKIESLVVFQFLVTIALIASTWIIIKQLQYVENKNLGYSRENVLTIRLNSGESSKKIEALKTELHNMPDVISAGASSALPGGGLTSNGYVPEGKELPVMINVLDIDDGYLSTMDMDVVNGRNFDQEIVTDKTKYLVNEALVNEMGWQDPIGKLINRGGDHEVIGVVRDFNYATLHSRIEPLIFTMAPWDEQYNYLSVKVKSENIVETIERVETAWITVNEAEPFEFGFLDQEFESLYYKERRQAKLLFTFSLLAIFIAGMGLFGIVSYSLEQKTKEIGVRKVLGASQMNLLIGLSRKYVVSIVVASVIAIPAVYYLMEQWLTSFFYRVEIMPAIYILSALITLIVALLIINIQATFAIRQDPTESLRYE
ncbi:MAG: ABC transporter permease [Bacteroidota bacterium]